ncbi:MAG: hypothetical protein ACRYG8_42275 [Janthinobacterium lividum]
MTKTISTPPPPIAVEAAVSLEAGSPETMPRFILLAGRGNSGKTLLLRWLCGAAQEAGRAMPIIADGDRTNRTLGSYFAEVSSPANADDLVVDRWLEGLIQTQVETRRDLVLDLGGGDLVLRRKATADGLLELFAELGVCPVVLHLIGPEVESLSYLASLEEGGVFAPDRTALVLNDGLVPAGQIESEVFEPVRAHPVFRQAVRRGCMPLAMPSLRSAREVSDRRLTFHDAAHGRVRDGQKPIGPFERQRIRMWLRAMDAAFAPIVEWLP